VIASTLLASAACSVKTVGGVACEHESVADGCLPEYAETVEPSKALSSLGAADSGSRPFDSLDDLLGNVVYKMGDEPAAPLTDAVIVADIIDVSPGSGFRIEGNDAPGGIETGFDDPRALWRTVHVKVSVVSTVSGSVGDEPLVGLSFGPDTPIGDIDRELRSLGQVLLFLNRSPVFAYAPEVYGTVMDGALVGTVRSDGSIRFPVLESEDEKALLHEVSTIDELEAAGDGPKRLVRLNPDGTIHATLESNYEFEEYPGSRWYGPDGEPVSEKTNIINAITGPEHCGWQTAVMMHVGWPPGHDASDASESHQFIRDPEGAIGDEFTARFDRDAEPPPSAKNSGYRTNFMELWLDPQDTDSAYLIFSDHAEKWPRAREIVACA
jgi:hypothetical protein